MQNSYGLDPFRYERTPMAAHVDYVKSIYPHAYVVSSPARYLVYSPNARPEEGGPEISYQGPSASGPRAAWQYAAEELGYVG